MRGGKYVTVSSPWRFTAVGSAGEIPAPPAREGAEGAMTHSDVGRTHHRRYRCAEPWQRALGHGRWVNSA